MNLDTKYYLMLLNYLGAEPSNLSILEQVNESMGTNWGNGSNSFSFPFE